MLLENSCFKKRFAMYTLPKTRAEVDTVFSIC